jgi:hypothetical protein
MPWRHTGEWHCPIIFVSALETGKWLLPCPGRYIPGNIASGIHWIGDRLGLRAGTYPIQKTINLPLWELNPGRPASRYTDWAILTHNCYIIITIYYMRNYMLTYNITLLDLSGNSLLVRNPKIYYRVRRSPIAGTLSWTKWLLHCRSNYYPNLICW